ncbi:MAG: hypothetical protein OEX98_00185 [Nitrosopumilus sp.]|nr:hypothetical protein [Nitrosopumilus sp.]MDH5568197.1 hypothetical protein [Nitrosopumilus sp.]
MKKENNSSEKIEKLMKLLENARCIQQACNEINMHKDMSYFTNNIETYLEGIVGVIEADIKDILLTEFLNGNLLIKQNESHTLQNNAKDIRQMVANSVYFPRIEKLDEL